MSITKRLLLTLFLLIGSLIATNLLSVYSLLAIGKDTQYFQKNTLPSLTTINDEILKLYAIRGQLFQHGLATDVQHMNALKAKTAGVYDELLKEHQRYIDDFISDERDRALSKKSLVDLLGLKSVIAQYYTLSETNNREAIADALRTGGFVAVIIDRLVSDLRAQIDYNNSLVHQANKISRDLVSSAITLSGVATLAATLVLGAFAVITIMTLRRRLNAMKEGISTISASLDLSRRLEAGRQDEIGLTVSAFNQLVTRVADALQVVSGASRSVSQSAEEIGRGNEELSARTEQQSAAVVETAASMEQLSSTVKQNAHNAQLASELAATASNTAVNGGKVVSAAIVRMKDISESSRRIADITSVINGIAFQTNILALNAAVEAARAGDQGRGFAVVAGEVRSLAQRSAQAAKEIERLIADSVRHVDEGVHQVDLAGESMSGIVNSVTRVKVLMQEIAAASDEQNHGIAQIAMAMTEMDTTTQHNATLVQASSASVGSLEQLSGKLQQRVDVFRLPAVHSAAIDRPKSPHRALRPAAPAAGWESI